MVRSSRPHSEIDITAMPDLARLAEEVARTGTARVLIEKGTQIAVISPATRRRSTTKVSETDLEQILASTFGAWDGLIDPEEFKLERQELQVHDAQQRSL